ncbi:MAG: hypothetical protein HY820_34560 [Acidobacteria bacterium]|nr:hypothetical protein [Acidobacteriota bacterium]
MRPDTSKLNPLWTLLLPLIVLPVIQMCPPERRLYSTLLSTVVFVGIQWLLPKARFRLDYCFSPVNVALVFVLLKIVVSPVLIMLTGGEGKILSQLPAWQSMENALLIDTTAALALAAGLSLAPEGAMRTLPRRLRFESPGPRMTAVYLVIGLIGFVAAFGSIANLKLYFTGPNADAVLLQILEGSIRGVIGTFLRPFLAFAVIAWWTREVENRRGSGHYWKPTVYGLVAALLVTFANATFSFNRAAFVFPLVSMLAVYHVHVRRLPMALLALGIAVGLPVLMSMEGYRSRLSQGKEGTAEMDGELPAGLSESVQAYSVGPQYTGTFYEKMNWAREPFWGSTLIGSVMSPVPILGRPFRAGSGPVIFNRAIYDKDDNVDQILPFAAELFVNFHSPGVLFGFLALGMMLALGEGWFLASKSSFAAFCLQYMFLWMATLSAWSVAIFVQIMIYFFGPIYFFAALGHARNWLRKVSGSNVRLDGGMEAAR